MGHEVVSEREGALQVRFEKLKHGHPIPTSLRIVLPVGSGDSTVYNPGQLL
jgi:hypothetical protein